MDENVFLGTREPRNKQEGSLCKWGEFKASVSNPSCLSQVLNFPLELWFLAAGTV